MRMGEVKRNKAEEEEGGEIIDTSNKQQLTEVL